MFLETFSDSKITSKFTSVKMKTTKIKKAIGPLTFTNINKDLNVSLFLRHKDRYKLSQCKKYI